MSNVNKNNITTIYARQVPPEEQRNPMDTSWWNCHKDITITGNKCYVSHQSNLFTKTVDTLREFCIGKGQNTKEILTHDFVENMFRRTVEDGKSNDTLTPYTDDERDKLVSQVRRWLDADTIYEHLESICNIMSLWSNTPYVIKQLIGTNYSKWQYIIHPQGAYTAQAISKIAKMYFNLSTEWIVHTRNTTPTCAEDVDGISIVCFEEKNENLKAEIAKAAAMPDAKVVLWAFDHYINIPKYTKVM